MSDLYLLRTISDKKVLATGTKDQLEDEKSGLGSDAPSYEVVKAPPGYQPKEMSTKESFFSRSLINNDTKKEKKIAPKKEQSSVNSLGAVPFGPLRKRKKVNAESVNKLLKEVLGE